jgi:flavin reductase (DIM6/NTAB) family NADH-FMN oxidoreductase RutF
MTRQRIATTSFSSLMASYPTGVVVVTTIGPDGRPWGMTCSSLCSVALEPPTVLVCLRSAGPTARALLRSRTFTLNFLHERATQTARLFASGRPDRFDVVTWHRPGGTDGTADAGGPHLTDDALGAADCLVTHTHPVGDHTVVFGEVIAVSAPGSGRPLMYGQRRFEVWPTEPRPDE